MREAVIRTALPVDLGLTLSPLRHGPHDPTVRRDPSGAFWRATRTPEGPATACFTREAAGGIRIQAWGPGAPWAIEAAPELLGAADSLEGFAPRGKLEAIHRRHEGLRITRSRAVYEATVATVFEQLVTSVEAHTAYRRLTQAWSEPAPGPPGLSLSLMLPLAPSALATRAYYELAPFGVEMKRAGTLRAVGRSAAAIDGALLLPREEARRRLESVPGIGPWTYASVALVALGDPDAVPVGDYHLPNVVSYAFTGEPRGDDARMLELLAPYAGHRGRVLRLIAAAGISAPRFGPKKRLRRFGR